MKSVAVVMDYQNVHMTGADVFRPNQPRENSLISPYKFGMQLVVAKKESSGEDFELSRIEVFRGLPRPDDPSGGYRRNNTQKEAWEMEGHGVVAVTLRPLKYRFEVVNGAEQPAWESAAEKGVDVLCALALCRLARCGQYDVVVLASRDTDLIPALDEAVSYRKAKIEAVKWYDHSVATTRSSLKTQQRLWTTSLNETHFLASLDSHAYQ